MLSHGSEGDFLRSEQLAYLMISCTPVDDFPFAEGRRIGIMLAVATKTNPTQDKTLLIQVARLHWRNIRELCFFEPEGIPTVAYLFFRSLASAYSTTVVCLLKEWMPAAGGLIRDLAVETGPPTEPEAITDHPSGQLWSTVASIEKHATATRSLSIRHKANLPLYDMHQNNTLKRLWIDPKLAPPEPEIPMMAQMPSPNQSTRGTAKINGYAKALTGGLNPTLPPFKPAGPHRGQVSQRRRGVAVYYNPQDFHPVPRETWAYRDF